MALEGPQGPWFIVGDAMTDGGGRFVSSSSRSDCHVGGAMGRPVRSSGPQQVCGVLARDLCSALAVGASCAAADEGRQAGQVGEAAVVEEAGRIRDWVSSCVDAMFRTRGDSVVII